jgi:hypothetical protein
MQFKVCSSKLITAKKGVHEISSKVVCSTYFSMFVLPTLPIMFVLPTFYACSTYFYMFVLPTFYACSTYFYLFVLSTSLCRSGQGQFIKQLLNTV